MIDTFIFNGEFDILDIRLMTMWNAVDFFILVESNHTFTGKQKKLHFWENRHKYAQFASKIMHFVFDIPANMETAWDRERAMRNSLFRTDMALRDVPLKAGDLVLVSDLDEIVEPTLLEGLKWCDGFGEEICFNARFDYYSYEFVIDMPWNFPDGVFVRDVATFPTKNAEELRKRPGKDCFHKSAWHCSYCFRHLDEFVNKLKSFSHVEYSGAKYTNKSEILHQVSHGLDMFHRKDVVIHRSTVIEAPPFVIDNQDCFIHMLNRTAWAANIKL